MSIDCLSIDSLVYYLSRILICLSINVCLLIYCIFIVRLEMSVLSMSVRQEKACNAMLR